MPWKIRVPTGKKLATLPEEIDRDIAIDIAMNVATQRYNCTRDNVNINDKGQNIYVSLN